MKPIYCNRLFAALLCFCMMLSLAACGESGANSSDVGGVVPGSTTATAVGSTTAASSTTSTAEESTTTAMGDGTTAAVTTVTTLTATTTKQDVPPKTSLDAADFILDPQVHGTKFLADAKGFEYVKTPGFFVDSEYTRYSEALGINSVEIQKSLDYYGFYTERIIPAGEGVGEWGFTFTQLQPGAKMGDGRVLLEDVHYSKEKPNTRADALRIIKTGFLSNSRKKWWTAVASGTA